MWDTTVVGLSVQFTRNWNHEHRTGHIVQKTGIDSILKSRFLNLGSH